MNALDELCEGPGCDQQATHLEGGRALCDKPACKNTQQSRFAEKKFSEFEPEDGFGPAAPIRHVPVADAAVEPASTTHHIHHTACKMYRRYPAPPQGSAGCTCEEIAERQQAAEVQKKKNMIEARKRHVAPVPAVKQVVEPRKPEAPPMSEFGKLNLEEALRLYKEGKSINEIAALFKVPVWHFYQSQAWKKMKEGVVRDAPVRAERSKPDARHSPNKTPKVAAAKVSATPSPQNIRGHLRVVSFALEAKIADLTKSLMAIRDTLVMLDKYPDILP